MINDRYYIDKLTYKVGEVILYQGKEHKIAHIHEDGLINLENGWFFVHGVHPNVLYKLNVFETIT